MKLYTKWYNMMILLNTSTFTILAHSVETLCACNRYSPHTNTHPTGNTTDTTVKELKPVLIF